MPVLPAIASNKINLFDKKNFLGTQKIAAAFEVKEGLIPHYNGRYNRTDEVIQHIRGFLFQPCYHPYMEKVLEKLNEEGFESIFSLLDITDAGQVFAQYKPNTSTNPPLVYLPLPEEKFYFEINEPYAQDNWITFYHIIILIVETLLANNKADEAIVWIENCLYNPKVVEVAPDPKHTGANAKYWKLPIFKDTPVESTTQFFKDINTEKLQDIVNDLQANPFNPFIVAYRRPQEFMMFVVNLYVKAHIAKGDIHFRMAYNGGGMDYLNLALEYYKVANIQLGGRPETIPNILKKKPETYSSLKEKGLRPDMNALVQYENMLPFCSQNTLKPLNNSVGSLLGGGPTFYFSIPADTATLELFDLIDDRLGKLRSCRDIDGVLRKIDLFGTPINPAQLLSALAKGLSLGDILGSMFAPAPVYKFNFSLQKAIDACMEVKSLGNAIASAIKERDNEQLALLRAANETEVLNRLTPIKERQVYESEIQKQVLLKTVDTAISKLNYYQSLLGISSTIPNYIDLPQNIDAKSPLPPQPCLSPAVVDVDVSLVDGGEKGVTIIPKELQEISSMNSAATDHAKAGGMELTAALMNIIPSFSVDIKPIGIGAGMSFGGNNLAAIFSSIAKGFQNSADGNTHDSSLAAKFSSYIRREQEWTNQLNLVKKEIPPLHLQLAGADVRIQITTQELANHKKQITEAQNVHDFMANKESNFVVHQQIIDRLKPIHKNFYDLAMYYARSAEQSCQLEKPEKIIDYISYDYDNTIVGCATVGDKLQLALKQLEKSYLEDSQRPKEMKKTISLSRLDPMALLRLRKEGKTTFKIPEWLLLLDNRGIYNARWLSLNFTFPMIIGPNTNLSAAVRMEKNYIRTKKTAIGTAQDFAMKTESDGTDNRFVQSNTPFKEVIISTGLNDSGFNLDPSSNSNEAYQQQYHPFEHAGFISEWSIDLNQKNAESDYSQVNWDSLSDVIISGVLNIDTDYGDYAIGAGKYIDSLFKDTGREQPFLLLLDVKNDLANELNKFRTDNTATQFSFNVDKTRFPYITQNNKITLKEIALVTKANLQTNNFTGTNQLKFERSAAIGSYSTFVANKLFDGISDLSQEINNIPLELKLDLPKDKVADTFILLNYSFEKVVPV